MTSVFIVCVYRKVQMGEETTAPSASVHDSSDDNTAFGNDVPAVPQRTGLPAVIYICQALLYAP